MSVVGNMTAADFHATIEAKIPTRTVSKTTRKGRTFSMTRFADGATAYQIDGGKWVDRWAVESASDMSVVYDLSEMMGD